MFKQNSKYRLTFLILTTVVFVLGSVMNFYEFSEKKDGMKMAGGIVFGVMAVVYVSDLYEFIKIKKALIAGHE